MYSSIREISMSLITPLLTTSAYIIYTIRTNKRLKHTKPAPRKLISPLTFLMAIHNLILVLFSVITLLNTVPAVYYFFMQNPISVFIKDPTKELQNNLDFYIWLFYISKVYELVDSFILHANGHVTSFLQIYHHTGAILCCWMLVRCDCHLPWIFVCLNSFIHALMYFYFFLTSLRIKVSRVLKRTITRLQIVQFVTGSCLLVLHVCVGTTWRADYWGRMFQYFTLASNLLYVSILFVLFRRFEKETYKKKKKE